MYRSASPYRAPSPFRGPPSPYLGPSSPYQQPLPSASPGFQQPQAGGGLQHLPGNEAVPQPGSVIYTTSNTPDGRIVYNPFKAVPASYQTPNGVVSGIQWVPAEATHVFPIGGQPAPEEFSQAWQRGTLPTADPRVLKDWQKTEEKRRRREEKESAKMLREKRREEEELRYAREADAHARERRKSFNAGAATFPTSPYAGGAGYPMEGGPGVVPGSPYAAVPSGGGVYGPGAAGPYGTAGSTGPYTRERKMSTGHGLADQFSGLDIEPGTRARRLSTYGGAPPPGGGIAGGPYSASGGVVPPPPGSPYQGPARSAPPMGYGGASPNMRPGEIPYGAGGGYAGSGMDAARSRATTPIPGVVGSHHSYGGASPGMPSDLAFPQAGNEGQLAAPEGFSRSVMVPNPFIPFETLKIQVMDKFLDHIPRMPAVLTAHDVHIEDWSRFVQDLALAWAGRLPVPVLQNGHKPKRSTLSGDLVELWNTSFFMARGVEAVLYKGRERRTGARAGEIDLPYALYASDEDSDAVTSSSESEEDSDDEPTGERYETASNGYLYNRPGYNPTQMAELADARRRRQAAKLERKQKRKEKKMRKKAKARAKSYTLVLTPAPPPGGGLAGYAGGMGGQVHGMPGTPSAGYAGSTGGGMMGGGVVGGGMAGSMGGGLGGMQQGNMGAMPGSLSGMNMGAGGIGGGGMY
ncbi:hypothetical protein CYLTODRAFT_416790 [Cylindrobasidium torrendii FP15055 ss-10]|uniref:Uncharacterized protein n=1 Tax=Cylindrobasidium torrendii FP15055 ss-10 TaxID=1314674 RepID=A0A0D7BUC9_9AGAR|nr:hypothetical protein CYLTODRAFT_416790 [Cylindrobasidium torrendii FP15055 ss-10]